MSLGTLIVSLFFPKQGGYMISYLTQKVLQFQKESESLTLREELIRYCQIVIYTYPVSIKIIDQEEASELLLYVFPRLETLLLTFTYNGVPFENYMKKIAFLQAHSFNKMKRKEIRRFACDQLPHEDIEYFIYSQHIETGPPMTPHLTYGSENNYEDFSWSSETTVSLDIQKRVRTSAPFKRRMLHLILLCSDLLTPSHISFLATFLEMKEIELANMITKAIELSNKRILSKNENKRIRDSHYFEKEFLVREKEYLLSVEAHPYYIDRVERKLEKESRYYKQVNKRLKDCPTAVTHLNAGKVTGSPKGTVDSGLQALFNYLKPLVDEKVQIM